MCVIVAQAEALKPRTRTTWQSNSMMLNDVVDVIMENKTLLQTSKPVREGR